MFEILTILAIMAFLFYREYLHYRQVQDLTLKIKAGSAQEYAIVSESLRSKPADVPAEEPKPFEELDPEQAAAAALRDIGIGEEE